jgi:hypothetical protein
MSKRHRRLPLSELYKDDALIAARQCRDEMLRIHRSVPIAGSEYQAASAVMDALDGLAEALTGQRRLWHTPEHGGGVGEPLLGP